MKRARRTWLALIVVSLFAPHAVDYALGAAPAPPSQAAADIGAWKGIEAVRCFHFRPIHHTTTYLCVVKVQSGCVAGLYQYRPGRGIGWFSQSLRPVKCWKTSGGPTS